MKTKLGKFFLGHETVDVYIDTQYSGAEAKVPGEWIQGRQEVGEVIIGLASNSGGWPGLLERTLHEAQEYLMAKAGTRYQPDLKITNDTNNCIFVLSHIQFTQVVAGASEFLAQVVPSLRKVYSSSLKKKT